MAGGRLKFESVLPCIGGILNRNSALCGRIRTELLLAFALLTSTSEFAPEKQEESGLLDFQKQIAPILVAHCLNCRAGDFPKGAGI